MMKLGILCLTILLMIGSCKKENAISGVVMEASIHLYIVDEDGNNLLKDRQFVDGLRLFYIVSGNEVEVYDTNMTYERNFFVFEFEGTGKYEGEPLMRVFANTRDQNDTTKAHLKWGDGTVDTLTTEIIRKGANLWVRDIWLNGDLVWSEEIGKEKYASGEVTAFSNLITLVK